MDREIVFPPWPSLNIYADTETYLELPPKTEPGLFTGTPEYNIIIKRSINVPWLLVGNYKETEKGTDKYSLIHEDNHLAFFKDLQRIYSSGKIPVIHFHNTSFDITAITVRGKELDPDLVLYTYVKSNNKTFIRGALYSPKFGFKCRLEDTMQFEMISIERIGNLLGKPKGKNVPYTMCNLRIKDNILYYIDLQDGIQKMFPKNEYIKYALTDVEIQRDYAEALEQKKLDIAKVAIKEGNYDYIKKGLRGKTQSSFAKFLTDIYLGSQGFNGGIDGHFRGEIPKDNDELYQQTIKSNMGGYTTFHKDIRKYECQGDELISVFDCNSEYPYILTKEIPYGMLLDEIPQDTDYVTWYVVSFKKCAWKDEMSCLKYGPVSLERLNERNCLKFYMLKEYYEMIDRLCDHESSIHEIKYQKTTLVFRDFINRLYSLRKELKDKMSTVPKNSKEYAVLENQQSGCKLIMNCIYGKLCEKKHLEGCYYYSKTLNYDTFENKEAVNRCILSGSYVTYKGRLLLLDKIEKCIKAGFKVLYADTDSVMFVHSSKSAEQVVDIFGVDDGELGEGKCEGLFNIFVNSGIKKKYCLLDLSDPSNYKMAGSGINKKVPELFKKKLDSGCYRTIEALKLIFDPNHNIVFKKQKRVAVLNNFLHQKIIYDTDFQMNNKLKKVTGRCEISDNDYEIILYGKEE